MDRSLKLLNYATLDANNNLVLYTELNHTFNVNDIIYIVGGYYDNVNDLQFNNPFTSIKYKVLQINNTNNSFTIDVQYNNINDIIFPYGTLTNQYGDETDSVELAYNNYTTGMHKGVYVSKCVINNATINGGIINNGIVGSDENNIIINNTTIRHIVSKNTSVKSVTITDKLFNNPLQTRKFTRDIINNQLINIPTGPNNNEFGFSVFEKITNLNDNITINGNEFINQGSQFINFNFNTPIEINNSRIGNNNSLTNDNIKISGNITFNNCLINGFKYVNNNATFNNCKFETYKDINCTGITINGVGDITFGVNYLDVENNTFINGTKLSILNLWYNPLVSYDALRKGLKCTIADSGYIYNDAGSGFIRVNITNNEVLSDWASYVTYLNNAVLDELKLSVIIEEDLTEPYETFTINNSTVFSALLNDNISMYNSNVIGGYYNNIKTKDNTFTGIDDDVIIKDVVQLVELDKTVDVKNFDRVYVNTTKQITGKFDNFSIIDDAFILDSELNNTIVNNINLNTFIYNSKIKRDVIIDENIFYDRIKYEENAIQVINNNFEIINEYPEGRNSKWVTGLLGQQLPLNDYAMNVNSLQNGSGNQYYERYKVENGETLVHVPNLQHLIDTPNSIAQFASKWNFIANRVRLNQPTFPLDGSKFFFWKTDGYNMNKSVLYHGILNPDNMNLYNALINRTDYIESSVYTHFTGTSLPAQNMIFPNYSPTMTIQGDDNFVYNKPQNNILSNEGFLFHDIVCDHIKDTPNEFPDYTINEPNIDNIIQIRIDRLLGGSQTYTLNNNDNINVDANGTVEQFDLYSMWMLFDINDFKNKDNLDITKVPAPFIEIEYFTVENTTNNKNFIIYRNYVPPYTGATNNTQYALDNIIDSNDFPNDFSFIALEKNYNYKVLLGETIEYKIVYWITWWYENESYTVGAPTPTPTHITNTVRNGHRTRHEFNFTLTGV